MLLKIVDLLLYRPIDHNMIGLPQGVIAAGFGALANGFTDRDLCLVLR